jgi:hypothetical protein
MEALLDEKPIALEDLKAAFTDHGARPSDLSICRHGPYQATRCSVILYPCRSSVEVLKGAPCTDTYTAIEGPRAAG